MAQTRGKRDYLFKRSETGPWWIKLQPPKHMTNGKLVEKSLFTTDRATAELLALPYIEEHKRLLLAARMPEGVAAWRSEFAPGLHDGPDGGKIFATTTELHYLDKDGRTVAKSPNGGLGALRFPVQAATDRPSLQRTDADGDAALLEVYISHAGLNASRAKEARDLLHLFKVTTGKTLANATRDDGRKLVAAMGDVKTATAVRKLVPLRAAVNLAISEGKHAGINPFANVVGKTADPAKQSVKRRKFDDDDMKIIRANLHKLSVQDQLLCRLLACTGMRLGEAFSFKSEATESGVRYVEVAGDDSDTQKTEASWRRVPLPKILLKYLPKKIAAPLFTGLPNAASTRLGKWLRDECKITDPRKVAAYSYRHKAKDDLRIVECPEKIAEAIFGRDDVTMGDGYGDGFPVPTLKKWIDRIEGLA